MKLQHPSEQLLAATFAAMVLAFVGATAYAQYRAGAIDASAIRIEQRVGPRIERLTEIRLELQQLPELVRGWVETKQPWARDGTRASRERIQTAFAAYEALPRQGAVAFDNAPLASALASVDAILERLLQSPDEVASAELVPALRVVTARAATLLLGTIDRQAQAAEEAATRIEEIRVRSSAWAFVLDALATLMTCVAAFTALRVLRAHHRLLGEHARLLSERADEMEQFSGRVAHDLLNPLGGVSLGLQVALGQAAPPERVREALIRAQASVVRTKHLVDALLAFARSGAQPDGEAHCKLSGALRAIQEEFAPAASSAGIRLSVTVLDADVRCAPGLVFSILENLLWNAIKYMGERSERRIDVSAVHARGMVRVKVADTGPGLPRSIEANVFKPFVRGPDAQRPGTGLGLATVKRLVEAHGGRVGVVSGLGLGCEFWFELPSLAVALEKLPAAGSGMSARREQSSGLPH